MKPWPSLRPFAVRVAFVVVLITLTPFPFGYVVGTARAEKLLSKLFNPLFEACGWLGGRLVGYRGALLPPANGSGDRLWDWSVLLGIVLIAPTVALLWTLLDRRRRPLHTLEGGLRVYVRYWLAAQLLSYGYIKLTLDQMPYPAVSELEQPVGALGRMGLLWSFMAASPAYERFAGLMELGAGLLLLTRWTSLIGALATAGVMLNVFVLNLAYDVCVKIFSCLLFLTALALAAYDARWLLPVLLQRSPPPRSPSTATPRRRRMWLVAELLGVAAMLTAYWEMPKPSMTDAAAGWPLYGRWLVLRQVRDGHELPPVLTEPQRWRTVYLATSLDGRRYINADRNNEERFRRWLAVDEAKHGMTFLAKPELGLPAIELTMAQPDADHLTLRDAKGDFVVELLRQPRPYLLQTRGFHWVSEEPLLR